MAMRHHFVTSQWLPHPVELVFAFFANPQNLAPLMPKWQAVRLEELHLSPPPPRPEPEGGLRLKSIAAGKGTVMTISFKPFPFSPVRIPWDAKIAEFEWNEHFCDEQMKRGPFAYWKHCHRVKAETRDGQPGTLVTDDLTYAMRLGPLGELAHIMGAQWQIQSLFDYRHKRLAEILSGFKLRPRPE
jgi:ligand-binding SRPBCC domain-containing protein